MPRFFLQSQQVSDIPGPAATLCVEYQIALLAVLGAVYGRDKAFVGELTSESLYSASMDVDRTRYLIVAET